MALIIIKRKKILEILPIIDITKVTILRKLRKVKFKNLKFLLQLIVFFITPLHIGLIFAGGIKRLYTCNFNPVFIDAAYYTIHKNTLQNFI